MQHPPATGQPGRPRPSEMSEAERWDWHAEVYAFRRVRLEVPDEVRTSPCDPEGVWFDERRVEAATARLRAKVDAPRRAREAKGEEDRRQGRRMMDRWARSKGFPDYAAAEAMGHDDIGEVVRWVVASAIERTRMPQDARWRGTAADLGVTATEKKPEFRPTPEQMAEARRALGLEEP